MQYNNELVNQKIKDNMIPHVMTPACVIFL